MAITALHSAATGLSALSTEIDIIANNLANVNTAGFKTSRANFEDLLYQEKAQAGAENANGDRRPAGLYVGLGTRISNTQLDFTTGSAIPTSRPLDAMIDGQGFFQVSVPPQQGSGIAYSRAGNFFLNADGDLVLGNADGPRVEPSITIPRDALDVQITSDGTVDFKLPGQTERTNAGRLQLANFINPAGLKAIGGNLYVDTPASGPPTQGNPGEANFGTILASNLESSNVDPVKELVSLIKTQRAFEMNSQTIQAADQALQVISNLRRF